MAGTRSIAQSLHMSVPLLCKKASFAQSLEVWPVYCSVQQSPQALLPRRRTAGRCECNLKHQSLLLEASASKRPSSIGQELRGQSSPAKRLRALPDASANGAAVTESSDGIGILEFLRGKNILITGATGFLAKVLVEKILREQPDVGQLYLVIQARPGMSAQQRLEEHVVASQLFELLRDRHGPSFQAFISSKLTAVSGDVSKNGLGISSEVAQGLQDSLHILLHSAATTTFDERYDIAVNINTLAPKRLLRFARDCKQLQLLLHVSTAFVNGLRRGVTEERPFVYNKSIASELSGGASVLQLSVEEEIKLAGAASSKSQQEAQELGMKRAQQYGWQDTYVFTKALGEMLLCDGRGSLPVAIVRPSIVESALQEPLVGWMEGIRMADPILLSYGKGQMGGFLANPDGCLDMIPVDRVINAILAAMAKHAGRDELTVYHVATSVANPLRIQALADSTSQHFRENPMLNKDGSAIPVEQMQVFQNEQSFLLHMFLKYQLPLQIQKYAPWRDQSSLAQKRANLMLKTFEQLNYLAKIYAPYTFYACQFDASNAERLFSELSPEERQRFPFDLHAIDWNDYICRVHLPGLRRYVLKGRGSRLESLEAQSTLASVTAVRPTAPEPVTL